MAVYCLRISHEACNYIVESIIRSICQITYEYVIKLILVIKADQVILCNSLVVYFKWSMLHDFHDCY